MDDNLVRDVPDEVVAAVDVDDLHCLAEVTEDLADLQVMDAAWQ